MQPFDQNLDQPEKTNLFEKIKPAFAFKLNSFAIIKSNGGQIKLNNGQRIKRSEYLIAVDGSGYPISNCFRCIYQL